MGGPWGGRATTKASTMAPAPKSSSREAWLCLWLPYIVQAADTLRDRWASLQRDQRGLASQGRKSSRKCVSKEGRALPCHHLDRCEGRCPVPGLQHTLLRGCLLHASEPENGVTQMSPRGLRPQEHPFDTLCTQLCREQPGLRLQRRAFPRWPGRKRCPSPLSLLPQTQPTPPSHRWPTGPALSPASHV